jgi:hypothetical protein
MLDGQLHPLLGDIVDAAGAGRSSRMRPFDLSGAGGSGRNRGAGHEPTALFASKAARAARAARAGPRHLHATHNTVCADFGLGRVAARVPQGYRFQFSNVASLRGDLVSSFNVDQWPSPLCAAPGLTFGIGLVISRPGESRDRHVCEPRPRGHDVLCTRIFSTNSFLVGKGAVVI